jgi:5'(3')-deoxyribonucleotidase
MNIFLDFDDTIVESIENVVRIANKRYNRNVQISDIHHWDFTYLYDGIPRDDIIHIFGEQEFFDTLRFKRGAILTLQKFSKRNFLNIVSRVIDYDAMMLKYYWINEHLNGMNIPVGFMGIPPHKDKSIVDMSDGIAIDDNAQYLNDTNAKYKILFDNQNDMDVNQYWTGDRVYSWYELDDVLSNILSKEKGITNGKI